MFQKLTIGAVALATLTMPVAAGAAPAPYRGWDASESYTRGYYSNVDYRDDRRDARRELRDDRRDVREERREYRDALRYGDRGDIREERREFNEARRDRNYSREELRRFRGYDYNRPDPRYRGYYADNYYRSGQYYQPRRLSYNDRVYRGNDGRYYCRRNDGTTGLIIGGLGGGALGNVIAPGGSKTLGTIIGGGLGAVLGNQIDRNNVRCR